MSDRGWPAELRVARICGEVRGVRYQDIFVAEDPPGEYDDEAVYTLGAVPSQPVQGLVEALEEAHAAIKKAAQAFIVVEGTLKKPYEDDPRWSPWTRFIDRADNDAWPRLCRAETTARKALADFKAKNNTEEA